MRYTSYSWPIWKKFVFCFFFIYLIYSISPWYWFNEIPFVAAVLSYWDTCQNLCVQFANSHIFHIRPTLVLPNGSGDTSWAWTDFWMTTSLSLIGSSIWIMFFRKRTNFDKLDHWLILIVRYSVSMALLSYGIIKLFALQMVFPNQSQLATPLGDYLPMRLSWLFIGYSKPYQIFSGVMEVIAGLLLLWRNTATLGALLAIAIFTNVYILNMAYDIPVKLYSLHLLIFSIFISIHNGRRIVSFFFANQSTQPSTLYNYDYGSIRLLKYGRWVLKPFLIFFAVILPFFHTLERYNQYYLPVKNNIVANGHYEVVQYSKNGIEVPYSPLDTLSWKNMILEGTFGSMMTKDTVFRQRYGRGYFNYTIDTAHSLIHLKKMATDTVTTLQLKFNVADSIHLQLNGLLHGDSIHVELIKVNRHFPLEERQFHWLSEYNR